VAGCRRRRHRTRLWCGPSPVVAARVLTLAPVVMLPVAVVPTLAPVLVLPVAVVPTLAPVLVLPVAVVPALVTLLVRGLVRALADVGCQTTREV
jgi:hypothetical protein